MAFAEPKQGLQVVLLAAVARVLGVTMIVVSLGLLWRSSSIIRNSIGTIASEGELDRIIVIMDASKSMNILDAGPDGSETRASRARMLIHQLISQMNRMPRTTLMAFGESALPVVFDAKHWDVLSNVLLRQYYSTSFASEKTDIDNAVQKSFDLAKDWIPRSTVVVLVTDGESEPSLDAFDIPASIREFVVLGVGTPEGRAAGKNLTEVSRLDEKNLRRIANLAGGDYFDGTREWLPQAYVDRILPEPPPAVPPQSHRDFALIQFGTGVSLLAALPLVLSIAERRLLHF